MAAVIMLTAVSIGISSCAPRNAAVDPSGTGSRWVRYDSKNKTLILFIHGLFGDATSSWTNPSTGAYWPRLVLDDPDRIFDGVNIYVYEYPSPLFDRTYAIDELAEHLRRTIQSDPKFGRNDEFVFLAHSMSGLIVRSFLVKYREEYAARTRMIYFFGTPTTGSSIANVFWLMNNAQIRQLVTIRRPNEFLRVLRSEWNAAPRLRDIASYCAYEKQTTLGRMIVEEDSATSLCNRQTDPLNFNHFELVKPTKDPQDERYAAFRAAFRDSAPAKRAEGIAPQFIDPVVEIALGSPMPPLNTPLNTIVSVQNSGVEPIADGAVYIRCLHMRHQDDAYPSLMYWGTPNLIGNVGAWWRIGSLEPEKPTTKDAKTLIDSCLQDADTTNTKEIFLFVADVVYRRTVDRKQYHQRAIMALHRDGKTGNTMFWPLFERTELHEFLARNAYPPGWERLRQ